MNFAYDANGRQVKATKTNSPDAWTVYDALENRVTTKINDVWQYMIYDAFGKLVAEYGSLQSTDEGGVKYVLSDWQGSIRATVSNTGFVKSRTDYTAFGEEIGSGTGLRTSVQGLGNANNLRQKYGLTERDGTTGLDHMRFREHENQAEADSQAPSHLIEKLRIYSAPATAFAARALSCKISMAFLS